MATVVDTARAILAAFHPQTGTRATGNVLATATSASVAVPRNSTLIPIVDGQTRPELLIKVAQGTYTDPKHSWLVTSAGTSVGVLSNIGGLRHNFPTGTVLRWDPAIAGISPTVTVQAPGLVGGADPTFFAGIKSAVVYEEFGGPQPTLALFRSRIGLMPGAVLVWEGSEPADGAATNQIERGASRMARDVTLYRERYLLVVIVNRKDSDDIRRSEGLEALDGITEWLTDKQSADGFVFSSPSGLQIRDRFRLGGEQPIYQQHYVYAMRFSVVRSFTRRDMRTYNDWLRTRMSVHTGTLNPPTDLAPKPIVENQIIDMSPGGFSTGFSNGFAGGFG